MNGRLQFHFNRLIILEGNNAELTLEVVRDLITSSPIPLPSTLAQSIYETLQNQAIFTTAQLKTLSENEWNAHFAVGVKKKLKEALGIPGTSIFKTHFNTVEHNSSPALPTGNQH